MDKILLGDLIREFISNFRFSFDSKIKSINSILNSFHEDNELLISKCK